MRISFLGPSGSFSEAAALQYYSDQPDITFCPSTTILDALEAVDVGDVAEAIVPIENSIEGAVSMTLDGLVTYEHLYVHGEAVLPIVQHLLAVTPTVDPSSLTEVWSHPQALGQCRQYLKKLGVQTKAFSSTSSAAFAVAEEKRVDVAAIGPASAGKSNGLHIIASQIQDNPENHTRFVVVGHISKLHHTEQQQIQSNSLKTMLVVTPSEEHSGVLASMLNVFAALGINLTWIESRPTKRRLGTYQFYLDAETGVQSGAMQKAQVILSTFGHDVRVLGSYPKASIGH